MTLTPHEDSNSYSPELLNSMEQAFKAVWQMLYAHMPVEGELGRRMPCTHLERSNCHNVRTLNMALRFC